MDINRGRRLATLVRLWVNGLHTTQPEFIATAMVDFLVCNTAAAVEISLCCSCVTLFGSDW